MSEARRQHVERLQALVEHWGAEVRAELDAARKDLSPEDFKDLHRNTVDELNRRVRELLGIEEPA